MNTMNIMKHPIAVASLTTVTALAGLAAYSTAPVASPVNDFTPTSAGMPAEPAAEPSAEMGTLIGVFGTCTPL